MIVLDTHIWVWWVAERHKISNEQLEYIRQNERHGLGISPISCWEVAKLVEKGKLQLSLPVDEWLRRALEYPGIQLLELNPQVAVESTRLPGSFHRDPADQIIVATARVLDCPLLTADEKILAYPYVDKPGEAHRPSGQ